MTTPDERTRALVQTREFLWELVYAEASRLPPEGLREQARRLLRHFPRPHEVKLVHLALPNWFASPFPQQEPD